MEFLGDAVLELVLSHKLYEAFPEASEGELTKKRAFAVSREHLARVCVRQKFEDLMVTGYTGNAQEILLSRTSVLSNLFEAIIGAIYLDSGFPEVQDFISSCKILDIAFEQIVSDPKGLLQEFAQSLGFPPPIYKLISKEGPDHELRFKIGVEINGTLLSEGTGPSKKTAQTAAAKSALELLGKAKTL